MAPAALCARQARGRGVAADRRDGIPGERRPGPISAQGFSGAAERWRRLPPPQLQLRAPTFPRLPSVVPQALQGAALACAARAHRCRCRRSAASLYRLTRPLANPRLTPRHLPRRAASSSSSCCATPRRASWWAAPSLRAVRPLRRRWIPARRPRSRLPLCPALVAPGAGGAAQERRASDGPGAPEHSQPAWLRQSGVLHSGLRGEAPGAAPRRLAARYHPLPAAATPRHAVRGAAC